MAKTYTNPDPKRNNTGIVVNFEGARPNITIDAFNDDAKNKSVVAKTSDGIYTLWADEAYDAVGDWTSEQAIAKVKELALAGKKK
jgi:hypothetical protein